MSQFNFEAEPFGEFTSEQGGTEQEQETRDHRSGQGVQARPPRVANMKRPWVPVVMGRPVVGRPVVGRHVVGLPFVAGYGLGGAPRIVGGGGFWRGLGLNRGYGYHRYRPRYPHAFANRGWGGGPAPAAVETAAGEWIVRLQASLATLVGDWVPQSGVLDVETRRALSMFQKQQQLPVTGAPDEVTLSAIEAASASPGAAGAQEFESDEFESDEFESEEGEGPRRLARARDFLPDIFAGEMEEVQQEKLKDVLTRLGIRDRSTQVSLQIPEAPYSAKLITSIQKGLDVIGAVDLALGVFGIEVAALLGAGGGLALTAGLPLLAAFGTFVALGAPYAEAREEHAKKCVRKGFARGVVLSADRRKWSYVKQRHWQRIPHKNTWDEEMGPIGQKAFNLGLTAGFVQGRKLSIVQRNFMFDSIVAKFTAVQHVEFTRDNRTEDDWFNWYNITAKIFLEIYAKD